MKAILYARVTTSDQREASLDDQLRECEDLCRREGFSIVGRETDHGISGESTDRPSYQRVLRAIERGDADVIVAHELTRLWRSQAEQYTQVEQFEFRGRHVVTCDGVDTRRDGYEFLFAVKGAQAKTETKRIATRVHRTHKGLVLNGRSTGGRTYGYRSEPITDESRKDAYGRLEVLGATRVIDPGTAEVVRRVFTMYADGMSPRRIAAQLNSEGVPSPGALWRRKTRRTDAKWLASAIHGDPKRGAGILNNELYVGRVVWNRRQMKKQPGTSKRVARMRTAEDRILHEEPLLRIISDELWQRVKDRQAKQAHELGTRVIGGLRKHKPGAGRPAKYLLSGLLKCAECHAGFILSNGTRYQCASHVNGGNDACKVSISVTRERAERQIRGCVRTHLSHPDILAQMEKLYSGAQAPAVDCSARLATLDQQERNLTAAIKDGGDIPALLAALKDVQTERAKLRAAQDAFRVRPVPRSAESLERRIERLLQQLDSSDEGARAVMQQVFPDSIWLQPSGCGKYLIAVLNAEGLGLLLYDWQAEALEMFRVENSMVAGAGFEPATFGL